MRPRLSKRSRMESTGGRRQIPTYRLDDRPLRRAELSVCGYVKIWIHLMRACFIAVLALSLLVLPTSQPDARDVTEMPLGSVVTSMATIGNKQVPLLKGEWKIVQSSRSIGRASGAPLGGAVLVRITGSKHRAIVSIRTNLDVARAAGWKRPGFLCDRDNVHFNESDRNYNAQDADCWQVNHYINTRSVESRTGAPALGSGGWSVAFASGLSPAPMAAFPVPAHQTGHADFPHPAFGRDHAFAHGKRVVRTPRRIRPCFVHSRSYP